MRFSLLKRVKTDRMAYSMLATLPPINGIYMSVFPILMYTIFGTSRHLTIGKSFLLILFQILTSNV